MAQTATNIENKTPDAAYVCKDNILLMNDTVSRDLGATARTQHATKMDARATDMESTAATTYGGSVVGNVKRGKQ